jgi:hypothetical protein
MPDKKVKFTRWSLGLVFLLSFVLNNIWQGGENHWAYWVSRFLNGGEAVVFGMAFLIFPKVMMKVCTKDNEDLSDIPDWKFKVIGLIAGIPFSVFGIYFFSIGIKRWLIAGCYFIDCLLSTP